VAMVKTKNKLTFDTKVEMKRRKIDPDIKLILDYQNIDRSDVYGFYLTNRTTKNNPMKLPDIGSFVEVYPDFIALETETGLYNKTILTAVSWFKDDSYFDTIDGIYNAIVYKDITLLKYYKTRYKNVKLFISVDYSTYGDFDDETLLHNIKKACIVYLWFTFECDAIVYPLMTYGNKESLSWCFEHIMEGSNVAVSLKGVMNGEDRELFILALKVLIDSRKPKALIVYSVSSIGSTKEILKYAYDNDVKVIIVNNTLMVRNTGGGC